MLSFALFGSLLLSLALFCSFLLFIALNGYSNKFSCTFSYCLSNYWGSISYRPFMFLERKSFAIAFKSKKEQKLLHWNKWKSYNQSNTAKKHEPMYKTEAKKEAKRLRAILFRHWWQEQLCLSLEHLQEKLEQNFQFSLVILKILILFYILINFFILKNGFEHEFSRFFILFF